jgi:hypothetical protein
MKLTYRSASRRYHTHLARVMACVLLVGIFYSATFGAVHSHPNVPVGSDANISTGNAGISEMPVRGTPDGNQCLICVLHRDFSSSTVSTPVFVVGTVGPIASLSAPVLFHYSNTTKSRPLTLQSGRAPPRFLA